MDGGTSGNGQLLPRWPARHEVFFSSWHRHCPPAGAFDPSHPHNVSVVSVAYPGRARYPSVFESLVDRVNRNAVIEAIAKASVRTAREVGEWISHATDSYLRFCGLTHRISRTSTSTIPQPPSMMCGWLAINARSLG